MGSRPDFAVLLYPVVLMDGPFVHAGSRRNLLGPTPTAERRAQFSLEKQVRNDLPHSSSSMPGMTKWFPRRTALIWLPP
jgi:hypothetical protein